MAKFWAVGSWRDSQGQVGTWFLVGNCTVHLSLAVSQELFLWNTAQHSTPEVLCSPGSGGNSAEVVELRKHKHGSPIRAGAPFSGKT